MNPLLIKYGLMALALGCALMGAGYGGYHYRDLSAIADASQKDAALERARSEHDAAVSKFENKQIEDTLTLQAAYDEKLNALQANNDGSQRRITDLVRQARAFASRCAVSGEAANPASPTANPSGSDGGLSERIGADFNRAGFGANKLAEDVKLCVKWAAENGR